MADKQSNNSKEGIVQNIIFVLCCLHKQFLRAGRDEGIRAERKDLNESKEWG